MKVFRLSLQENSISMLSETESVSVEITVQDEPTPADLLKVFNSFVGLACKKPEIDWTKCGPGYAQGETK